jgi:hypothetical protein
MKLPLDSTLETPRTCPKNGVHLSYILWIDNRIQGIQIACVPRFVKGLYN